EHQYLLLCCHSPVCHRLHCSPDLFPGKGVVPAVCCKTCFAAAKIASKPAVICLLFVLSLQYNPLFYKGVEIALLSKVRACKHLTQQNTCSKTIRERIALLQKQPET